MSVPVRMCGLMSDGERVRAGAELTAVEQEIRGDASKRARSFSASPGVGDIRSGWVSQRQPARNVRCRELG